MVAQPERMSRDRHPVQGVGADPDVEAAGERAERLQGGRLARRAVVEHAEQHVELLLGIAGGGRQVSERLRGERGGGSLQGRLGRHGLHEDDAEGVADGVVQFQSERLAAAELVDQPGRL
jgi:hypothetical protein